jgi:hypothetical protein
LSLFLEYLRLIHDIAAVGGQGITSGFRDSSALAWRLAIATRNEHLDHESLLRAWYRERQQQLERSLAVTIENGNFVTEGNPIKVLFRDAIFAMLQLFPSWRRWFEQGARREGMIRYSYEQGMHFLPDFNGGKLLPQVYCRSIGSRSSVEAESASVSTIVFSDDVIFAPQKKRLFQLLVLVNDLTDAEKRMQQDLSAVDRWSDGYVLSSDVTFLIHGSAHTNTESSSENAVQISPSSRSALSLSPNVLCTVTAAEFAESPLCISRPPPLYYDPLRLQKEVGGRKFVVIRHDRFIFATCDTLDDLQTILRSITPVLSGFYYQ